MQQALIERLRAEVDAKEGVIRWGLGLERLASFVGLQGSGFMHGFCPVQRSWKGE